MHFFATLKLIEHIVSAVKVCSNACVGSFSGIEMSFFPKITTFWANPPPGKRKLNLLSNPIP